MTKAYFWYSAEAHSLLSEPYHSYEFSYSRNEWAAVYRPGHVQVLPDGRIATYRRDVPEFDATQYRWGDVVYVGEYDANDVLSVPANTFDIRAS